MRVSCTLKSYSVPNLELYFPVADVHCASAELDSNGEIVLRAEALVRELKQEAALADACTRSNVMRIWMHVPVSPIMMYLKR